MSNPHAAQVHRLQAKLLQLLEFAQPRPKFAQQHHLLQPPAPLGESEVAAFESHHRIRLPEDHRAYLTVIGNGGPGPGLGILPLEQWWRVAAVSEALVPDGYLQGNSPLRPELTRSPDWIKDLGIPMPERWRGTIAVSQRDALRYSVLVVTGEFRGRVVHIDMEGGAPRFAAQRKFLDWYEDWLDETLEWGQYESA